MVLDDEDFVTLEPLNDASVQITFAPGRETTALVTWRAGKDNDMTAKQLAALGRAFLAAAAALLPTSEPPTS